MKVRTLSIIAAAIAALTLTTGCVGSRGSDATSDTTPTSSTVKPKADVTEGSFAELRKTCTVDDRKAFNAIVRQFSKYPKATDTPATAPFADELKFILGDAKNVLYAVAISLAPEDSCLKAFVPYLPAQPTSGGNGNGGGGGGGSGGTPTQSTVGGNNCSGGNIDPDGTGPRGCEPTVPSDVGAGGGNPTQPTPPPAAPVTTEAPATTPPATAPTTDTTQPVVIIDGNGQPVVTPPANTDPPVTPNPGECWIIDGVPQGNCN